MTPETSIHILLFCVFAISGVFAGISIAAFGHPPSFIQWATPIHWLTRRFVKETPERWDRVISYFLGMVSLMLLTICCFALGGFLVTSFFALWGSPFSRILMPH